MQRLSESVLGVPQNSFLSLGQFNHPLDRPGALKPPQQHGVYLSPWLPNSSILCTRELAEHADALVPPSPAESGGGDGPSDFSQACYRTLHSGLSLRICGLSNAQQLLLRAKNRKRGEQWHETG